MCLDVTYCRARVGHRIMSQAIIVAVVVPAEGRRGVLGFEVGGSENEGFRTFPLPPLTTRELDGAKWLFLTRTPAYCKLSVPYSRVLVDRDTGSG